MMIDKEFDDVLLNDFLDAYEDGQLEEDRLEEEQLEEDQLEEDQLEEDQLEEEQQYNVYNLNSTVFQSTSAFMDTTLDDLPILDICCMFFFAVCVFLLFNIFNGGNNNVGFN